MMNSKCLVTIFELKKSIKPIENIANNLFNEPTDKLVLNVYLKTTSIIANLGGSNQSDEYFIDLDDNKLYKYDINGQNPQLINGTFLIAFSNDTNYINNAYKVSNGDLEKICTYFDGTNLKLIINGEENNKEGTLILTDDYKIFVRIGKNWFGK